jgi:hypothetical protein
MICYNREQLGHNIGYHKNSLGARAVNIAITKRQDILDIDDQKHHNVCITILKA